MLRTVWVVQTSDCEASTLEFICATKEVAEKKLFEVRDRLIQHWKEMAEYVGKKDDVYVRMIKSLSTDDYESWDNYPHDRPHIFEMEITYNI